MGHISFWFIGDVNLLGDNIDTTNKIISTLMLVGRLV
jgi:hypothetical protein